MAKIIRLVHKKKKKKKKARKLQEIPLEQGKGPALFDMGLPNDLEEAILLLYALSFGPLSRSKLMAALKLTGMTMPNGSSLSAAKIAPITGRLGQTKRLISPDSGQLECNPEIRWDSLDQARQRGWLLPFGRTLQEIESGQISSKSWDYEWDRQRFVSFGHACRDVFLALENQDHRELTRLADLCRQDQYTMSIANILYSICIDPFQTLYLKQLNRETTYELLYLGIHHMVLSLNLGHPIFDYVRSYIDEQSTGKGKPDLSVFITHVAERDLLCGQIAQARTLLDAHQEQDTHLVRGMMELICGNPRAAQQAYDRSLQGTSTAKRARLQYLGSFPALLHTLLLVQSDAPQDRTLAGTWLNWLNDAYDNPYRQSFACLRELLAFHQGRLSTEAMSDYFPRHEECRLAEAAQLILLLLSQHYNPQTRMSKSTRKNLLSIAKERLPLYDKAGVHWLAWQITRGLDKLSLSGPLSSAGAQAFFDQSDAIDLSELWPKQEVWENQLSTLQALISPGKSALGTPASQSRRLGWKLVHNGDVDPDTDYTLDMDVAPVAAVIPVEQKLSKNGAWTKGREIALHRLKQYKGTSFDYLTEHDREVCTRIRKSQNRYYRDSGHTLDPAQAIQALAGHENVFWDGHPHTRVEIIRSEPEVRIVPNGRHLNITVDPFPCQGTQRKKVIIIRESSTRLRAVVFSSMHTKIAHILGAEGIRIPIAQKAEALERLQDLSKHLAIQSNVALTAAHAQSMPSDSHPHLRLQRLGSGLQADMIVLPLGKASARSFVPGAGNQHLIETIENTPVQTQRNLSRETQLAQQGTSLIPALHADPNPDYCWTLEDPMAALQLLEQLQDIPPKKLSVEWPKGDPITVRSISAQQFQISIKSAKDWFEVDGKIRVDQDLVVQMRSLLEEIDQHEERFIPIGDNQYLALTKQFRKDLNLLSSAGKYRGKKLRIHPLAAISLDQWKDQVGTFKADKTFDAHIDRIRSIESYQPDIPSTLQAELRPYQQEGFTWLARLAKWGVGACLADDMGLGKTLEALALILHRSAQGPTLVVAPTSVCANWVSETVRFAPTLTPLRFGLDDRGKRKQILQALKPFDLLVCTYNLLQQEAEALKDICFSTIVLDEAQAIKNTATKRSQAAMNLQGDFRMICTGTPIENRLTELWNLSRFINPGLLGSQKRFAERFVRPIELQANSHARHTLKALITPFILRRMKSQVLEELPPRTETLRLVELSAEERALHESLRQRALARLENVPGKDAGQKHLQILAELMKLRRCCCNPRLVMPECGLPGSKLQVFAELVDELRENNHKALVFSQFVDHLSLLRQHLDEQGIPYQYLDGRTTPRAREKRINAFQSGQGDLFLISLRAGGTGLNLTAADYVIHMDPWWNPAVEDQASDRAHRIGQTRPVTIYRLVAEGTIEEKIVQLHSQKRDLADSLLQGTDAAHKLSTDELMTLLRSR